MPDLKTLGGSPGVVTWKPSQIRDSVRQEVDKYLSTLPTDKWFVAEVNLLMPDGINAAIGVRDPMHGTWEAVLYVGKKFDQPGGVLGVSGRILF